MPCGGGTHTRERTCLNGVEGDEGCHEGSTTETMVSTGMAFFCK